MSRVRNDIVEWAEQGRIRPEALSDALRIASVTPTPTDWRRFLDQLALWLGVIFLAFGVIFFFAFNWAALGRFGKFALVELPLLAAIILVYRLRLDNFKGKAVLLGAALLMGALLALVGQTYQTGADPWELFAIWALAIFPWVVVGRFGTLWLLWIALLNLALWLYYDAFGGLFRLSFSPQRLLWPFFILNTAVLVAWELASTRFAWLRERWTIRILAAASGGLATALAMWAVVDSRQDPAAAWAVYLAWILAAYLVYRRRRRDLFVLAGGALSVIVMVTALMTRHLIASGFSGGPGVLLVIGLVVIGLSAASAYWLKGIAAEEAA